MQRDTHNPALPNRSEIAASSSLGCLKRRRHAMCSRGGPENRQVMPDDHSELVPPLPIPNRTVKRLCADDSAATSVKVGHRQAVIQKTPVASRRRGFLLWTAQCEGKRPRNGGARPAGRRLPHRRFALLELFTDTSGRLRWRNDIQTRRQLSLDERFALLVAAMRRPSLCLPVPNAVSRNPRLQYMRLLGSHIGAGSSGTSEHQAAARYPGIDALAAVHEKIFIFQNLSIAYLWDRLQSTLPGRSLININAYQLEEVEQMSTYKELQEEIERLKKDAEEARFKEIKDTVEQIKKLMAEYDLSLEDLQPSSSRKKSKRGISNVQFRDEFGNTWSGRGRLPAWLKGKSKEQFRVR
jgi:DNA-binding protein H-NS